MVRRTVRLRLSVCLLVAAFFDSTYQIIRKVRVMVMVRMLVRDRGMVRVRISVRVKVRVMVL